MFVFQILTFGKHWTEMHQMQGGQECYCRCNGRSVAVHEQPIADHNKGPTCLQLLIHQIGLLETFWLHCRCVFFCLGLTFVILCSFFCIFLLNFQLFYWLVTN